MRVYGTPGMPELRRTFSSLATVKASGVLPISFRFPFHGSHPPLLVKNAVKYAPSEETVLSSSACEEKFAPITAPRGIQNNATRGERMRSRTVECFFFGWLSPCRSQDRRPGYGPFCRKAGGCYATSGGEPQPSDCFFGFFGSFQFRPGNRRRIVNRSAQSPPRRPQNRVTCLKRFAKRGFNLGVVGPSLKAPEPDLLLRPYFIMDAGEFCGTCVAEDPIRPVSTIGCPQGSARVSPERPPRQAQKASTFTIKGEAQVAN